MFERIDYTVKNIDGDYAYLQQIDQPEEELKCVARALLPPEIVEGTRLAYEMLEYEIVPSLDLYCKNILCEWRSYFQNPVLEKSRSNT